MINKICFLLLGLLVFTLSAEAQQSGKVVYKKPEFDVKKVLF